MITNKLPDTERLLQLFEYGKLTGHLLRKERLRSEFKSDWDHRNWNKKYAGINAGSRNTSGHIQCMVDGRLYLVHRIIYKMMTGDDPSFIDHINCVKDDNRWRNLRCANGSQNRMNTFARVDNALGVKNIYKRRLAKCDSFIVTINGKHHGSFRSLVDAIEARNSAVKKLHGPYGR